MRVSPTTKKRQGIGYRRSVQLLVYLVIVLVVMLATVPLAGSALRGSRDLSGCNVTVGHESAVNVC